MAGTKTRHSVLRPLVAGTTVITCLAAATLVWTRLPDAQAQAPKAPAKVEGEAKQPAPKQSVQAPPKQPVQPAPKEPVQPPPPRQAQIDRNGVLILIRETLLALDHANKTGNYTVLRDLGAPGFQVNTAARLAEIFAKHRRDNIDLAGVLVLEPQLSLLPQIEANGMMHLAGFFPSVPTQVNFELIYAQVGGHWRLFGLAVSFGQAGQAAPQGPAHAPPQATAPEAPAPAANTSAAAAPKE